MKSIGCKFSLYVFENSDTFDISQCTDKYKKEFEKNSNWLKFGFHALNTNSDYSKDNNEIDKDYKKVINNLIRIVGEKSITNTIRIEKFLLNKQNAIKLSKISENLKLLGADTKDREDYFLNNYENDILFKNDEYYNEETDIIIYNTDLRIEKMDQFNIAKNLDELNDNNLIIFTHEWMFNGLKNRILTKLKIEEICKYAINNGYRFDYP